MFGNVIKKITNEENIRKDFMKLAIYVKKAKGNDRSIGKFSAECRFASAEYLEKVIKAEITAYPDIRFLKLIADHSEGRVSLKELTIACGYSNYKNNDLEQIKNIRIERGAIYFCNFSDRGMDSEVCGHRPVLVIQNSKGNMFSSNTKVLTITSRSKAKLKTHVQIGKECGLKYDSIICCELEDTVSKRRLINGFGVAEKIAECSEELMLRVSVACAKADGWIDLDVPEEEAIRVLKNLNQRTQKVFQYENNYGRNMNRQVAFA